VHGFIQLFSINIESLKSVDHKKYCGCCLHLILLTPYVGNNGMLLGAMALFCGCKWQLIRVV